MTTITQIVEFLEAQGCKDVRAIKDHSVVYVSPNATRGYVTRKIGIDDEFIERVGEVKRDHASFEEFQRAWLDGADPDYYVGERVKVGSEYGVCVGWLDGEGEGPNLLVVDLFKGGTIKPEMHEVLIQSRVETNATKTLGGYLVEAPTEAEMDAEIERLKTRFPENPYGTRCETRGRRLDGVWNAFVRVGEVN